MKIGAILHPKKTIDDAVAERRQQEVDAAMIQILETVGQLLEEFRNSISDMEIYLKNKTTP